MEYTVPTSGPIPVAITSSSSSSSSSSSNPNPGTQNVMLSFLMGIFFAVILFVMAGRFLRGRQGAHREMEGNRNWLMWMTRLEFSAARAGGEGEGAGTGGGGGASGPNAGGLDNTTIDSLMPVFAYHRKEPDLSMAQGRPAAAAAIGNTNKSNNISSSSSRGLDEEEGAGGGDESRSKNTIDGCAVCLSEFQEGDKLRFLPRCEHRFHTECIDMWFHSHSTCPLCRTPVLLAQPSSPPPPSSIITNLYAGNLNDGHHQSRPDGSSIHLHIISTDSPGPHH